MARRANSRVVVSVVILILCLGSGAVALQVLRIYRTINPKGVHAVSVDGLVLDGDTGVPVPGAHVIVVVQPTRMDSGSECVGLVADNAGRFSATFSSKDQLSARLSIIASAPNSKYAEEGISNPTVTGDKMQATAVELRTGHLPADYASMPRYQYATFCVGCVGAHNLRFLGPGWTPKYYENKVD